MMIYNDFKATNKCRVFIAKEPLFADQNAFAITKSDPMIQIIDYECVYILFVTEKNYLHAFC